MRLNPKAQSLFEFVVLLSLAAAAIAFMYQPVRNSLFGYFKSLDESVYDSETEIQTKAPPNRGGIGACNCGDWSPGNCGGPAPHDPRCQVGTRRWTLNPINCQPGYCQAPQCRVDPSCCSVPIATCSPPGDVSCCGANVSGFAPHGNYPGPGGDSCQDGQAKHIWRCGAQDMFGCLLHAGCDFDCHAPITHAQTCTNPPTPGGDPNNERRLRNNTTNFNLVNPPNCANLSDPLGSAPKCRAFCPPPNYIINPTNPTQCIGCAPVRMRDDRFIICGRGGGHTNCGRLGQPCCHRSSIQSSHAYYPQVYAQALCPYDVGDPNNQTVALYGWCDIVPYGGDCNIMWPGVNVHFSPSSGFVSLGGNVTGWKCWPAGGPQPGTCDGGDNRWAFEARVVCAPIPPSCPKPKLLCRALPVEDTQPFLNCGANEWELLRYTSGGGGSPDAKVTICCNSNFIPSANKPLCRPETRTVAQPFANCLAGETKWLEYCSGNCDPALDDRITICCNNSALPPTGTCQAVKGPNPRSPRSTGNPDNQWGECTTQGMYEVLRYCSGDCSGHWGPPDDDKVTWCCQNQ